MSGFVGSLSPKQEGILAEFREKLKDIFERRPHWKDDYFLTRWLRARNYDIKKSEAMLRNHDAWRKENNVDTILQDFKEPEVMKKYYTGGLFGQAKDGSLIWIDPNGYIDMKGILTTIRKQDIIRSKIRLLEQIYSLFEEKTKEQERRVDQIVIIFDLEKFGMRHLWKPGVDVFTEIVAMFEDHYPETLKKTFVVNAPRIFPIAYSLLRPFLSEATHAKVVVCSGNYQQTLLESIDADQLPKHWGGTCTDSDGNPRCPSSIVPGGMVPESYYSSNALRDMTGFTEVTIGRGSSLQLIYVVSKVQSIIRWQFKTNGYDIGFGVFRRTCEESRQKASNMETFITSQRVNSHMVPEDGSLQCKETGTYVLRFDNTYSWTRPKKLFYLIEVLDSQSCGLDMPSPESDPGFAGGDKETEEVWTSFPCCKEEKE